MTTTQETKKLIQRLLESFDFNVMGLWLKDGETRPLPSESSVVGAILEYMLKEHLQCQMVADPGLTVIPARSTRTYPDFTITGPRLNNEFYAVDLKCARRTTNGEQTKSAIAIGTHDAEYYHYPDTKVGNIMRPYASYASHLAIIALYNYRDATARDIELLTVEKWRVATDKTASGTRGYIAATRAIEDLRSERGTFDTEDSFNDYWRAQPVKPTKLDGWKKRHGRAPRFHR